MGERRTGWRPPAIVRNRGRQPWYGWALLALGAMFTTYRLLDRPDPTPLQLVFVAVSVVLAVLAGGLAARGYQREQSRGK